VPVNWCAGQILVSPEDVLAPGGGLRSPSGQEERKKRKGKTESISTFDILGLPMQLRCTGGSVLILAVRISLGCEEDKMVGGVQMMWRQIRQDFFQEWFVDRREKGERAINPLWLIWVLVVYDFSQVFAEDNGICNREWNGACSG
jgi:hypothetical protein